ncbi:glutaredoxin family protein [Paenibacillus sp. CGMCC 1.16610]|nr:MULTISPECIES: glutaredoxin family protein [Paenibacillus]MBA2939626.1 glutaredoxin family protein [Paenibacillus sp. CGMCC 1.16610]
MTNVTIFKSDHCSACHEAISYFEQLGIHYKQLDVTFNQSNFNEMLRKGGIATPFIIIGSQSFEFFDPDKIKEALACDKAL